MPPNVPFYHDSYDQWGVVVPDQALPSHVRAIFVGSGGTVVAVDKLGNTASFTAPQGILHICPTMILASSGASAMIWLA
jgi:hypothetical protein